MLWYGILAAMQKKGQGQASSYVCMLLALAGLAGVFCCEVVVLFSLFLSSLDWSGIGKKK